MVNVVGSDKWSEVEAQDVAVVDFNATWCGPCRMLAPIIEELSNEMSDCEFFACDVDDNGTLAQAFGIQSIPAVGVFKDGIFIDMAVGFRPKAQMKQFIEAAK